MMQVSSLPLLPYTTLVINMNELRSHSQKKSNNKLNGR